MNIYTLTGKKVRCINLSGGYNYDQELAKKHLEIGSEYTIDYTDVGSWHTDVFLRGYPEVAFNSVFFENVETQTPEEDARHPDYKTYH